MLTNLVDSVLNLAPAVLEQWGYAIVFIFSVVESLPLVGLAVPGGVIVIAAGFFAKLGLLKLIPVILTVTVGAFVGDTTAYYLGRYFGYDFLTKLGKYIFFKPVHFEKAKAVLHAHPRKTILGGRFHALTRCIIPFAAGAAGIKPRLFMPFAAISAVSWAAVNVITGYIFGQGFQVASQYLGVIFFIALALSVLVIYSYQFISRFTERNKLVIQRYQIYPLLLNLISISVFARIAESVSAGGRIQRADAMVGQFVERFQTPLLTDVFIFISIITTPTVLTLAGSLLAFYLMYRRRWYFFLLLPASLLSGVLSVAIFRKVFHVARPLFPLVETTNFSFPSGHATLAVIFFGLLAYFCRISVVSVVWRRLFSYMCVVAAAAVCFSRLYLQAHWLSDVLAGAALGLFWLTFFIVLFHFFTSLSPKRMEKELEKEILAGSQ